MEKNRAKYRTFLVKLVVEDNALRLRSLLQSLSSEAWYEEEIGNLIGIALLHKAWYSVHYLQSLKPIESFSQEEQVVFASCAVASGEPSMLRLALVNSDCVEYCLPGDLPLAAEVIAKGLSGMVDVITQRTEIWRYMVEVDWIRFGLGQFSATIQCLTAPPHSVGTLICSNFVNGRLAKHRPKDVVLQAMGHQDWMLLDFLAEQEPEILRRILRSPTQSGELHRSLVRAAKTNATQVVDCILRFARTRFRHDGDNSLLHVATQHGSISTVEYLIGSQANDLALNSEGQTPLRHALGAEYPSMRCMALLTQYQQRDWAEQQLHGVDVPHDSMLQRVLYDPVSLDDEFDIGVVNHYVYRSFHQL